MGNDMTCCAFDASQIQWFIGIVAGVFFAAIGFTVVWLANRKLDVGRVRPQAIQIRSHINPKNSLKKNAAVSSYSRRY